MSSGPFKNRKSDKSQIRKAELPFMSVAVDDFEAMAAHLTAAEEGMLFRLWRCCWRSPDCSVPVNQEWLFRRLRVHSAEEQAALETIISEFFTKQNGWLHNQDLRKGFADAKSRASSRRHAGSLGGKAKALKNKGSISSNANDLPEANGWQIVDGPQATTTTTTTTISKEEEGARPREAVSESKVGLPALLPETFDTLIDTLGLDPADMPRYWQGPAAVEHVARWKTALGLTDADIIAEAKASRSRNPEPPDVPKALDRWMEQAAIARRPTPYGKTEPEVQKAVPKTFENRLQFFADAINGPNHFPASAASPQLCRALLEQKLVTTDKLRERGLTW